MGVKISVIDKYERAARLYPALICLLPIVAVAVGVHDAALRLNAALTTLVASFGGLFLLASISRDLGKRLEPVLFETWGGQPTTQLLRHRDPTLDRYTKKRFHDFLGSQLGTSFPTPEEEAFDPHRADETYKSGVLWLLGKTRDKNKFPFVFRENVNYGFRRNCLGLKPVGLTVGFAAAVWTLLGSGLFFIDDFSLQALASRSVGAKVAFVTDFAMMCIWLTMITKGSVRRAALSYADALLKACDALPKKKATSSKNVELIVASGGPP